MNSAVCDDCDVVVDSTPVSRDGQPIYTHDDWKNRSRTGGRSTFLRPDNGLGTGVPWNARDWEKDRDSGEQRLGDACGQIERMASELNIPAPDAERAGLIYRQCVERNLVAGRTIDGFASVCLLIAARERDETPPVTTGDLDRVSQANRAERRNARGAISLGFDDLSIEPLRPRELLPRIGSEIGAPSRIREQARDVVDAYRSANHGCSYSPTTVAVTAFHAAYDLKGTDERPTLADLTKTVEVSKSTVSDRKSDLVDIYRQHSSISQFE